MVVENIAIVARTAGGHTMSQGCLFVVGYDAAIDGHILASLTVDQTRSIAGEAPIHTQATLIIIGRWSVIIEIATGTQSCALIVGCIKIVTQSTFRAISRRVIAKQAFGIARHT